MQVFHLRTERLHLVSIFSGLVDADTRNFEFFQTFYLGLQIVLIAGLTLLLVFEHALLQ